MSSIKIKQIEELRSASNANNGEYLSYNSDTRRYEPTKRYTDGVANHRLAMGIEGDFVSDSKVLTNFPQNFDFPHCSIILGNYLFVSTRTQPSRILKISLDTLQAEQTLELPNDGNYRFADQLAYSSYTKKLYSSFINTSGHIRVIEINQENLEYSTIITDTTAPLSTSKSVVICTCDDAGNIFVLQNSRNSYVLKYSLITNQRTASAALPAGGFSHGMEWDGEKLYLTSQSTTNSLALYSFVVRMNATTLAIEEQNISFSKLNGFTDDLIVVGDYLYAAEEAMNTSTQFIGTGVIRRFNKKNLSQYTEIVIPGIGVDGPCYGVTFDGGEYIYAVFAGSPGKIVRINHHTLEFDIKTLPAGENNANEINFDSAGRMFLTYFNAPGAVSRYYKIDFDGSFSKSVTTSERNTIVNPANGLRVYNRTDNRHQYYVNGSWLDEGTSGVNGAQGAQGAAGTSGTSGVNGAQGAQGLQGVAGTSGVNGAQGAQGLQGVAGTSGTSGVNGAAGAQGAQGLQGVAGVNGTSGVSGASGTSGTSGVSGIAGVNGTSGLDGAIGTSGTSGLDGAIGTSGTSGGQGPGGTDGVSGTSGTSGVSGATGAQGAQGVAGTIGVNGTSGTSGVNGEQGPAGGISGTSGVDGAQGPSGGVQGPQGIQGPAGVDGVGGTSGTSGANGAVGPAGPQGLSGVDGIAGTSGVDGTTFTPTGFSGLLMIPGNPPGSQELTFLNGILTTIS